MGASSESAILPLRLENVGFDAGGQTLLDGVNLEWGRVGVSVVVGPNGAGKSLLLRIAHGLLRPTRGTVRWLGPAGNQPRVLNARQAMVFQRPIMLRRSARANVRYALRAHGLSRSERARRAEEAMARFGLEHLGERSARVLSGGEQQRLALARAWALRPEVLFMDEPTSALDPAAVLAVEKAIRAFVAEGTRVILTTHDLGQVRRLADEVIFLAGGRVRECAPADRFLEAPGTPEGAAFLRGDLVIASGEGSAQAL